MSIGHNVREGGIGKETFRAGIPLATLAVACLAAATLTGCAAGCDLITPRDDISRYYSSSSLRRDPNGNPVLVFFETGDSVTRTYRKKWSGSSFPTARGLKDFLRRNDIQCPAVEISDSVNRSGFTCVRTAYRPVRTAFSADYNQCPVERLTIVIEIERSSDGFRITSVTGSEDRTTIPR